MNLENMFVFIKCTSQLSERNLGFIKIVETVFYCKDENYIQKDCALNDVSARNHSNVWMELVHVSNHTTADCIRCFSCLQIYFKFNTIVWISKGEHIERENRNEDKAICFLMKLKSFLCWGEGNFVEMLNSRKPEIVETFFESGTRTEE